MADNTAIEWTDATWNPVTGCSVVSPGCTNCYAMRLAGTRLRNHPTRKGLTQDTKAGPVWTGEIRENWQCIDQPLSWSRPRMIFVCAHADLFHPNVNRSTIAVVFGVMIAAHHLHGHIFQVLTKRSDRMRELLNDQEFWDEAMGGADANILGRDEPLNRRRNDARATCGTYDADEPPPGIWIGVSVEDQTRADERIPDLLATPAAVRWVSAEPLLGPIDFAKLYPDGIKFTLNALTGRGEHLLGFLGQTGKLDWIVVGGESGPAARPMHPQWVRDIRDQCDTAGVPFFFKQWGAWKPISSMSEAETDALYRPNRVAKPREDQSTLDELYGRSCTVKTTAIGYGGSTGLDAFYVVDGHGGMQMFHIGKKAAGRMLDGRTHDAMPLAATAPAKDAAA